MPTQILCFLNMPFLEDDCHLQDHTEADGEPLTKCARLILKAREHDPSIPICNVSCPISKKTSPVGIKLAVHDRCHMSLTTLQALQSGLTRQVFRVLNY